MNEQTDIENRAKSDPASLDGRTDQQRRGPARLGIALILVSGVLWAPLPVLPFLPISTTLKVTLAGVLFVGVQIAWWLGAALAGPEVVRRIRSAIGKCFRWKTPPTDEGR